MKTDKRNDFYFEISRTCYRFFYHREHRGHRENLSLLFFWPYASNDDYFNFRLKKVSGLRGFFIVAQFTADPKQNIPRLLPFATHNLNQIVTKCNASYIINF